MVVVIKDYVTKYKGVSCMFQKFLNKNVALWRRWRNDSMYIMCWIS